MYKQQLVIKDKLEKYYVVSSRTKVVITKYIVETMYPKALLRILKIFVYILLLHIIQYFYSVYALKHHSPVLLTVGLLGMI